jgi:hypothetical protein
VLPSIQKPARSVCDGCRLAVRAAATWPSREWLRRRELDAARPIRLRVGGGVAADDVHLGPGDEVLPNGPETWRPPVAVSAWLVGEGTRADDGDRNGCFAADGEVGRLIGVTDPSPRTSGRSAERSSQHRMLRIPGERPPEIAPCRGLAQYRPCGWAARSGGAAVAAQGRWNSARPAAPSMPRHPQRRRSQEPDRAQGLQAGGCRPPKTNSHQARIRTCPDGGLTSTTRRPGRVRGGPGRCRDDLQRR